jgi:hypothetical protein
MPYHLELGSEGRSFHGKAIVVNSQTGEHKSNHPIPMDDAKAQMRVLEGVEAHESAPKKRRILLKKRPVVEEAPEAPKAPEPPKEKHKFLYDMTMELTNLAPSVKTSDGDYIFPRDIVKALIDKLNAKGYKKEAMALREVEMKMPLGRGKPTVKSVTNAYKPIIALLRSLTVG